MEATPILPRGEKGRPACAPPSKIQSNRGGKFPSEKKMSEHSRKNRRKKSFFSLGEKKSRDDSL